MENKKQLFDREGRTFVSTHNLRGNNIDTWVEQYQKNEQFRKVKRKDSVYVKHEILSFHKADSENISIDKLKDIARQYMKLRNHRGMYVAVPHMDKDHLHIHICSSGIEYRTGKSTRMSRKDFADLKKNVQNYQSEKFPELSHSIVAHGARKEKAISDREYQFKKRTGKETNKDKVISALNNCYKKANSKDNFFELLLEYGLTTYIRGGRVSGIIFQDRKFRLKTLGFTEEKLNELNLRQDRSNDIDFIRSREHQQLKKTIDIERN